MELNFIQSNTVIGSKPAFECVFEITGDFNLHMEGVTGATVSMYQRTAGQKFARTSSFDNSNGGVVDVDFTVLVSPKTIKVVSSVMPTLAEVTIVG